MPEILEGRYVLLGDTPRSGGLSVVRKAIDTSDESFVAIKFVTATNDPLAQKIFEREVETLRSLNHPNIIRLRHSGVEKETGALFLVFNWVERSFADLLVRDTPYEWDELASTIAEPLASALSHAHLKQVEHRDIKPANVLITQQGTPLLADFGIAKMRSNLEPSELTVAEFRSGPYAPPETEAMPYVRDVYSMGVLLIQALHQDKIRDFHEIAPAVGSIAVPTDVRRLLEKCVDPDPSIRPKNGSLLAEELNRCWKDDRSRRAARSNMVWLKLTNSAHRYLLPDQADAPRAQAEACVIADLAGEVFAEYRFDHDKSAIDRGTIFLVGDAWRFTLKPEEQSGAAVVTAARQLDFESLEAARRRSMPVGTSITWSCRAPRDLTMAASGLELLQRSLEDFHDSKLAARQEASERDDEDGILDAWVRLLQAREDVARGERRPMLYNRRRIRGREADFTLAVPTDLDLVGTEVEIVLEEARRKLARGEVIAQNSDEITVRSHRPFPALPDRATLAPYLGPTQVALQRQMDAVSAIKNGTAVRPDLREIILDPATVSAPVPAAVEVWNESLDQSKQDAVAAALGTSDLLLVQGPPGTGKTSFITETVAQVLRQKPDSRVLIVSQTHVAVDNCLERLDKASVPGLVRLGLPDDPRVDQSVTHLLLDQQMTKWAAGLRRKAEDHLEAKAALAEIAPSHLRAALAIQRLISLKLEQDAVREHIQAASAKAESELATSMGVVEDASTLQDRLDGLAEQEHELLEEAHKHLAGDLTLHAEMSADDMRAAVDALIGGGPGQSLLKLLALQAEWLQRVASDQNLASAFLKTTHVIAGTCLGFLRHPAVRILDIDLCILDEASKATATETFVPLARSSRWIMVGDINQLPPMDEEVLHSPELLNEYNLSDAFVRETLFQRMADRLPAHSQHKLLVQYRMIRAIGDMISTCFYGGELISPRKVGLQGYDVLGKPVLWLDTKSLGDRRREDAPSGSGTSYANRAEAQVVVERLTSINGAIDKGIIAPGEQRLLAVLLIAPYRSQVDELRRRLASVPLRHLNVTVQSVDAVQGRETDIVIFSVTRSNAAGRFGFLGPDYWRRINVGLSRARFGLTIVGDASFCQSSPGALKDVLDYITGHPDDCEFRQVNDA